MSGYQPLERPLPQQQQQVQMQPMPSFNPNAAPSYARVPTATPVQVCAYPMLPPQQQQQQWQYAPVVAQQQPQQPHRVQQLPLPPPQAAPQLQQPMVREHPYAVALSPDHPGYPPVGQPGHLSRGKWSDGFCDCCDSVSICLTTCVLAPVRWAQTAERLKFRSFISALFMYGIPWVLSFMLWFISPHGRRHRGDGDDDSWDDDNGADDQSGGSSSTSSSGSTSGSDSMHDGHHHSSVNGLVVVLIMVAIVCNIITIVLGARYRGRIRKQFDIPGSACGDCMAHTCFPCCAISQEARHVDRDLAYPL